MSAWPVWRGQDMLRAHGWIVVRSSRERYADPDLTIDEMVQVLDDAVRIKDEALWQQLRQWLEEHSDPGLKWTFTDRFNALSGLLQFAASRDHRASCIWDMMRWIAVNGTGSYGIVYVHDDEDTDTNRDFRRGHADNAADYSNVFRVWRILNGKLEELDDPFLSPIIPTINPTEFA